MTAALTIDRGDGPARIELPPGSLIFVLAADERGALPSYDPRDGPVFSVSEIVKFEPELDGVARAFANDRPTKPTNGKKAA